ncbi:hypothetical protein QWZ14_14810 [Paeniroseomonas aquatica]|uniref:MORN repeat-containing protein n=2 Tax=Paeniroseomonas aquatica TaxID=373043 RepID=A0ABT8A890_9PROT|nr:hypothetical protein [Paeniroseomonas aquatica]MDN3565636.1 hypothetical protein [Paeniroseomonas aquatica]
MRVGRGMLVAVVALGLMAAGEKPGAPPEAELMEPGGRAGWVADPASGCWLWAGGIEPGATEVVAAWNGKCPEGPGEGTGRALVTWRSRGEVRRMDYLGDLVRGKNEGRGKLVISEGDQVVSEEEGLFQDDRLVDGRMALPRLRLEYEGKLRGGHPQGPGRLSVQGRVFEGDWVNGCLQQGDGWVAFTRPVESCAGQDT